MGTRAWAVLLALAFIASGAQGNLGALGSLGRRLAKQSRPVWKPTKRSPVLTTCAARPPARAAAAACLSAALSSEHNRTPC
jgi:hypothetical protein